MQDLELIIAKLDKQIGENTTKKDDLIAKIKQLGKANKERALRLLKQKKNYDKRIEQDYDRKMTLEEILFKLRSGANDVEIFKSLKLAKEAGDEVSQSTTDALGGADVGSLLDDITE